MSLEEKIRESWALTKAARQVWITEPADTRLDRMQAIGTR